jgi:hypothetical protein
MEENDLHIKNRDGKTIHWETFIEIKNKMIYFSNFKALNSPEEAIED